MGLVLKGHILLIVITIYFPVATFITYTMAVLLGHVPAWFPFISDTGTRPPESCVFGFFMGIYALLTARAIRMRYQQIAMYYEDSNRQALLLTNKIALFLGWAGSLGVYLVGNFQETNVLVVHLIGAFLAFIIGNVYIWVQTVLSYKTSLLPGHSRSVTILRLVLCILHTGCMIGGILALVAATLSNKHRPDDPRNWGPKSSGFTEHVVATFLEWVVAFISTGYFLTLGKEFHKFEVHGEKVRFLEDGNSMELNGDTSTETTSNVKINGIINY